MPEISVIVPVYNTEKYLPRCIESLLRQTFSDFELLLIDDGSTDRSALICTAYSMRDSRVRLIPSKHLGVCEVRNLGLENARGKYIMFCDSDDFVKPEWMERLHFFAEKYPDCLVNCEYAFAVPSEKKMSVKRLKDATRSQFIDKKHFFPMSMESMALHLWTRIFRADVISKNRLTFRADMVQGEDIVFIAEYLRYCRGFYYIKECLYFWTDNKTGSLSRDYHPHCFEDMKKVYETRKELIDSRYMQDFYDDAFVRFMKTVDIVRDERNTESDREKLSYCQKIFRDPSFRETVNKVSEKTCPRKKRALIKTGSFRLYRLLSK